MKHFKTMLLASSLAFVPLYAVNAADTVAAKPVPAAAAKPAAAPARVPTPVRPSRWFKRNDTNHDGKLSKQEFMTVHERYFNEADANRDSTLTPEEMKALADKKRAERAAHRGKERPAKK